MQANDNLKNHQPIEVVALALQRTADGRFLLARRGPSEKGAGEWEFPGGKIEKNEFGLTETQTYALKREIKEELDLDIDEHKLSYIAVNHIKYDSKTIRLFLWHLWIEHEPVLRLVDHDLVDWFLPSEMTLVSMSPGDIPFVEQLVFLKK